MDFSVPKEVHNEMKNYRGASFVVNRRLFAEKDLNAVRKLCFLIEDASFRACVQPLVLSRFDRMEVMTVC